MRNSTPRLPLGPPWTLVWQPLGLAALLSLMLLLWSGGDALYVDNPCTVGTAVYTASGYSCICPPGYNETVMGDNSTTCVYDAGGIPSAANYTARPGVDCSLVAATYGLPVASLASQNPGISCARGATIPPGTVVNVTSPQYNCSVPYFVPKNGTTLQDIAAELGLTAAQLADRNAGIYYTTAKLRRGQLVCLKLGAWSPQPLSSKQLTLGPKDTCQSIIGSYFSSDPSELYWLNLGLDCSRLQSQGSTYVSTGSERHSAVDCSKAQVLSLGFSRGSLASYHLRRGEDCNDVYWALRFSTVHNLEVLNKAIMSSFECDGIRMGTTVCHPKSGRDFAPTS